MSLGWKLAVPYLVESIPNNTIASHIKDPNHLIQNRLGAIVMNARGVVRPYKPAPMHQC